MEPERKIEKWLRAYARKRRAGAGDPLKLHPATRRLLQNEILRRAEKPETEGSSLSLWHFFRQQWAFFLGFTLMIFLGATLLLPTVRTAKREAQSISTMNNLRQIGAAAQIAADENNGRLPPSLDVLTNELLSQHMLTDPASGKPFVYVAAGKNLNDMQSNNVLVYSPMAKDGSAVLFADGRVEYANRKRFAELIGQTEFQLALADKTASEQAIKKISYTSASLAVTPSAQPPATDGVRRQLGVPASQSFVQSGVTSSQQNLYRNEAASAQSVPVLQSFQVLQNGDTLSVVDRDGSVYRGTMQFATGTEQNEPAPAEVMSKAAAPQQRQEKAAELTGNQQQIVQNYLFRVTGINQTLKQNVIFNGSLKILPGAASNAPQTFGGIGAVGAGGAMENNNSRAATNQQQWLLSNSRIVGTAVINETNRIAINAAPVTP